MQCRLFLGSLAATLVVVATAAPAHACPDSALCVDLSQGHAIREEVRLARVAPVLPALSEVVSHLQLDEDSSAPRFPTLPQAVDRSSFDSLWQSARDGIYRHLPTYAGPQYSLTLSPIVVATSFAKIPGLGVSGEY